MTTRMGWYCIDHVSFFATYADVQAHPAATQGNQVLTHHFIICCETSGVMQDAGFTLW